MIGSIKSEFVFHRLHFHHYLKKFEFTHSIMDLIWQFLGHNSSSMSSSFEVLNQKLGIFLMEVCHQRRQACLMLLKLRAINGCIS